MRYKIETERVDLFDTNILITMEVSLKAEVPMALLEAAFKKAVASHEVLNSKIIIEPSGEAYYVDNDSPRSFISETSLTLSELINENERKRFRIEEGEFIRAFVCAENIVFMMHHIAGDGKSLLYFIETFMKCLSGENVEYQAFRSLELKDLPAESKMPLFYRVYTKSVNRKWERVKRVFTFGDLEQAYAKFWGGRRTKVELKRYGREELASLLASAKSAGVSLTSYIITDMIKDSGRKMDVGLAVDGRFDKNRSMGNQATGISVEYKYNVSKSFDENARAVQSLMKKKLDNDVYRYFVLQFMGLLDDTLKDAMNLERAEYFTSKASAGVAEALGYGKKVKDISITNLTRVDIPLVYGDYEISEIAFVPPIVAYGKNIYGIVTTGDVMTVARHIYE